MTPRPTPARIGIFYPTDPASHVPSGIDTFIKGILKWAPDDLSYTLFGATADSFARPVGVEASIRLGERVTQFLPVVGVDPAARRKAIPLTVRYLAALAKQVSGERISGLDVLDFHRVEPLFLFRKDPRPKNVTIHQDMSVIRDKNSDILWRHLPWLYEFLERRAISGVDRLFTVRESAVQRYAAKYPEFSERFTFIPTWVDPDTFHLVRDRVVGDSIRRRIRSELRLSDGTRLLIFVGRFDRQKDPHLLLEALRHALEQGRDLHLVMIGDGVLKPQLEESIANALHRRVSMVGSKASSDIADFLRAADLFVLSSAYEGMPIAVLEALACGLPVVSTDVGEVSRVVKNGVNGMISNERTPAAVADAICRALDELRTLSGSACTTAVAPYHADQILGRIFDNHRRQARRRVA